MKCPVCHGPLTIRKTKKGKPMFNCLKCCVIGFVNGEEAIRRVYKERKHTSVRRKVRREE